MGRKGGKDAERENRANGLFHDFAFAATASPRHFGPYSIQSE
jgi:hypothetical protein